LFSFHGRINRLTYWVISILGDVAFAITAGLIFNSERVAVRVVAFALFPVWVVVALATQTKRWHDREKSGWWVFITLVPLFGLLWALIELGFLPGTDGTNRYGAPPPRFPGVRSASIALGRSVLEHRWVVLLYVVSIALVAYGMLTD
jgi:uncharacterized membrane protein YhaH (DUF805 family)